MLPWTALLLGLWIPNFYYWGLNQYITQRTLGSASLAEGQKGIVFAAMMKLILPLAIVIPGMIAFNLYAGKLAMQVESEAGTPVSRLLDLSSRLNMLAQRLARLYMLAQGGKRSHGLLVDLEQTHKEFAVLVGINVVA